MKQNMIYTKMEEKIKSDIGGHGMGLFLIGAGDILTVNSVGRDWERSTWMKVRHRQNHRGGMLQTVITQWLRGRFGVWR